MSCVATSIKASSKKNLPSTSRSFCVKPMALLSVIILPHLPHSRCVGQMPSALSRSSHESNVLRASDEVHFGACQSQAAIGAVHPDVERRRVRTARLAFHLRSSGSHSRD